MFEVSRENIGKRLKEFRKSMGLTITKLTNELPVSQGAWSELETGKARPSFITLYRLYKLMKRKKIQGKFIELIFGKK